MVVTSMLTLAGLGFVAATLLALASKVFFVEENPKVEALLDVLPGANCGGCGYAGCEGYAIAVLTDSAVGANLCVVGGAKTSIAVGEISGKVVSEAEPLVSFRRCQKAEGGVQARYEYQGMPSCSAVALLSGGSDNCAYSCIGYGDCVQVCNFDAMYIENDLVKINKNKCVACGACIKVCPRGILELIPQRARVMINCSTRDKLKSVTEVCSVGCINCGKCVKACPAQAVTQEQDHIMIDHSACLAYGPNCMEACVKACARHILRLNCAVSIRSHLNDENAQSVKELANED